MSFLGKKIKKVIKYSLDKCGYCICSNKYKNQIIALEEDKQLNDAEQKKRPFDIPPILLVAMPKSAGKYIRTKLSKSLDIDDGMVDNCQFPVSMLPTHLLEIFTRGNAVAHTHININVINGLTICKAVDRFVFHIRDPRNSIVSIMHHFDYRNKHIEEDLAHLTFFSQISPYLGDNYTSLSFNEKFDLLYEFYYTELLEWMHSWFQALEIDFSASRQDVYTLSSQHITKHCKKFSSLYDIETPALLTTHEDFVKIGEDSFFKKILDFYAIPISAWAEMGFKKDMSVHFRSGRTDSWKTELSLDQKKQLTERLPKEWCRFFNWEY